MSYPSTNEVDLVFKGAGMRNANLDALRLAPLFAGIDDDALANLAESCRRRRLGTAGQSLFHEGDDPGSLYIVISGIVHIRTFTAGGKLIHIAERGPGEQIGELSLLDGEPRMADAVTASPAELLVLGRDAFTRCVESNPKIALAIMRSLAGRLRQAARHLAVQEEQDVVGRVSRLLLARIGAVAPDQGEVVVNSAQTQQQMAEQIGSSRESVSRALSELRKLSVIRMEGRRVVITDVLGLRQQAERQ